MIYFDVTQTAPIPAIVDARVAQLPLVMLGSILAGTYELQGLLGSGGMAQVFDAHDIVLDRRVAVKVARPRGANALRAEGRALVAMRHPSVVSIFHAGVHDGHEYLVIERIDGPTLRAHLNERRGADRRLSIAAVITLVREMAEALAVVHGAGLSHRDVKPENVMISSDARVVLTDFGLTRSECLPCDDAMSGTPNYMAPEVIRGNVRRGAGHLVDLYALGVVAYEMIVGRTPFQSDRSPSTLQAQVFDAPSDPRDLRPDVPQSLAHLVLALLAKEPGDRPESAELVAALLREATPERQRHVGRHALC